MVLAIRSAKAEDAENLIDFLTFTNGHKHNARAIEYVTAMFSDSFRKPHFVIALDGQDIIGAAAYSEEIFTTNIWGISWVSINDASRHTSVRKLILEECLRQIERKADHNVAVVMAALPHRVPLYEKVGFNPIGTGETGRRFMTMILPKSIH